MGREGRRTSTGRFKHDFIIQTQTQFRHSTQVALHLHRTENLRSDDVSIRIDEEIDRFDDVEEDFVLAITDAF